MTGWSKWTNQGFYGKGPLYWETVGALYTSAFGSQEAAKAVPEIVRCRLYHTALIAYLMSARTMHWSDEERKRAIALSLAEIERRSGSSA